MISQTSPIHAERVQYSYRSIPNDIPNERKYDNRIGPPNEIEYDHRAYRIAYRMASRETVEITTKR